VATVAGPVGPAALAAALLGAAVVAAGATAAALLGAGAAALVAAEEALVAGVLGVAALLEDFLLAHPATKIAATPRKTVALIAIDGVRIAFFILKLLGMCSYLLLEVGGCCCYFPRRLQTSSRSMNADLDLLAMGTLLTGVMRRRPENGAA
jgi:hypothetical protein